MGISFPSLLKFLTWQQAPAITVGGRHAPPLRSSSLTAQIGGSLKRMGKRMNTVVPRPTSL
jgi:hypothetical protein